MIFFYNILIKTVGFALKIIGLFNQKIHLGVVGRSETFKILENKIGKADRTIWFHCASLGEFEQGFPVFKAIREHYKDHKIVLSFFSPSGYEIRKKTPVADIVVYLPLDTKHNAKKFVDIVQPQLTIFVKYEIWPNFLRILKRKDLRTILVSASFRENQPYFQFYGAFFRNSLFAFEHIFTQNSASKQLLESVGYSSVSVSGDTRFDRVTMQLQHDNTLDFIETFKGGCLCVVTGSTWPEDEILLTHFINNNSFGNVKFIIAPHNIKAKQIDDLVSNLKVKHVRFSKMTNDDLKASQVLIIDTIGLLSRIYAYADIAYVGGAMGKTGLHNTLEPAVFGTPIIIGPNHQKFPEAQAMIDKGGMFAVNNQSAFNEILEHLITEDALRKQCGLQNADYVEKHTGGVSQILNYLKIYNNYQ